MLLAKTMMIKQKWWRAYLINNVIQNINLNASHGNRWFLSNVYKQRNFFSHWCFNVINCSLKDKEYTFHRIQKTKVIHFWYRKILIQLSLYKSIDCICALIIVKTRNTFRLAVQTEREVHFDLCTKCVHRENSKKK